MNLASVCGHGNPARACLSCYLDDKQARRSARKPRWYEVLAVLAVLAGLLAFALVGCDGRPVDCDAPAVDAALPAPADAGAAPDVHEPQCRPLQAGEEFFVGARLVLNQCGCDRVCGNTAGGQTCIGAQLQLVDCNACQDGCSP